MNKQVTKTGKLLQNKGTAWCTRGYPTAETQLKGGDFYVYYTIDATGKPAIPRIAIRMEGQNKIAEPPRGVFDSQQNLEPNMVGILDEKLKEFGSEADTYRKKSLDMKRLTAIEHAMNDDKPLTRDDLLFLYEIDSAIEGFGYGKDPRIEELRSKRNRKEDIEKICDCPSEYIANDFFEITETTHVFCEDTGEKISFLDFREVKNQAKLPQLIELAQKIKESGSPARPDLSFEGGIISFEIDQKIQEVLRTYKTAIEAYKKADAGPEPYVYGALKNIPWVPPTKVKLDILVLNHGQTTPEQRDTLVKDMEKIGYRPLTFSEFVAFAIMHPDLNKRNEVLSTYEKYNLDLRSRVPSLYSLLGAQRSLVAEDALVSWIEHVLFLFVRV
jgi:hypothetical protein